MIVQDLMTQIQGSPLITALVPVSRISYGMPISSDEYVNDPNLIYVKRRIETEEIGCVEANIFQFTVYSKTVLDLESICDAIKQTFKGSNHMLDTTHYYRSQLLSRVDGDAKLSTGFYWSQVTFDFSKIVG